MKAIFYERFKGAISVSELPDPVIKSGSVIVQVKATGICRSDWHGWMGHDPDIVLPHVPGHEFAGEIIETGPGINSWHKGDRVTVPFVCGCGDCPECRTGNQQVCDRQFQPGFTDWGSFAQYVRIDYAEANLVRVPDNMDYTTAASLGCRFITSYRAVVHQGKLMNGQWLAVFGCGGVGTSAILIGKALNARVIAVDVTDDKLKFAGSLGADYMIHASKNNAVEAIMDITGRGVHVSLDALGSPETCRDSILSLRKRGKHIQVGLMDPEKDPPQIPMPQVIARELELIGSHGMQAHAYSSMFELINQKSINLNQLIGKSVNLEEGARLLSHFTEKTDPGLSIITDFN